MPPVGSIPSLLLKGSGGTVQACSGCVSQEGRNGLVSCVSLCLSDGAALPGGCGFGVTDGGFGDPRAAETQLALEQGRAPRLKKQAAEPCSWQARAKGQRGAVSKVPPHLPLLPPW